MMTSQSSTPLQIRPATPDDVDVVVRLIQMSMGVLADYLFAGVRTPVDEILAGLYRLKGNRYSWTRADIAVWIGEAAGMVISFSGGETFYRNISTGVGLFRLCNFFDVMRLALRALSLGGGMDSNRDEYYIANLAVLPQYQRRGIGSGLLAHVEGNARKVGTRSCSLIVDTEKPAAQRLYEQRGYQVVRTESHVGSAKDPQVGYYHMVKEFV